MFFFEHIEAFNSTSFSVLWFLKTFPIILFFPTRQRWFFPLASFCFLGLWLSQVDIKCPKSGSGVFILTFSGFLGSLVYCSFIHSRKALINTVLFFFFSFLLFFVSTSVWSFTQKIQTEKLKTMTKVGRGWPDITYKSKQGKMLYSTIKYIKKLYCWYLSRKILKCITTIKSRVSLIH